MTPEIVTLIVLAAIAVAALILWQVRKPNEPSASASTTSSTGGGQMPSAKPLTAADYSNSFFGGHLGTATVYPYKLPAGVKGYGPDGAYDKDCFDPRAFDAARERIIGTGDNYVDVRTLTRHLASGEIASIEPMTMRQWLYGLTIDPACVPKNDLLGQGIVIAPRGYLRGGEYTGPGSFGGGA